MFSFPASLLFAAEQKGLLLSCTAHLYQQSTYFDLRIQILFCIMYSTVQMTNRFWKAFSAIIYSPDRRKSIHYGWISNTAKSFLEDVFFILSIYVYYFQHSQNLSYLNLLALGWLFEPYFLKLTVVLWFLSKNK